MPDLAAALRAVMPPGMVLGTADPLAPHPLWPGEGIAGAVAARRQEFAAGRAAARAGLANLDLPAAGIPMAADRAPVWPPGVIGSISHCEDACMAALGSAVAYTGIGLDLEPLRPIEPELWPSLLTTEETDRIAGLPPAQRGLEVLRVFVAKEAAFKAQYPLTRALIGFQAIEIVFTGAEFSAALLQDTAPMRAGDTLSGCLVATATHLAALVWRRA